MADPAIAYTLSAILLSVGVTVARIPGSYITNLSSTVIQSPSQIQPATLQDGYVAHPDIGAAYKVHTEKVTWKKARELCISEGAHLAVIDTCIKFELLMNQTGAVEEMWVGIHKMHYEWVSASTGSVLTNLPWIFTEPFGGALDCVATGEFIDRGLQTGACNFDRYYYVCEVPIPGDYN